MSGWDFENRKPLTSTQVMKRLGIKSQEKKEIKSPRIV